MDGLNYRTVKRLAKNEDDVKKVKMILNELFPGDDLSVPDPYNCGEHGFKIVYEMLDEVCDVIANKLT